MSNLKRLFRASALFLALLLPFPAITQTTAGSISGQVTDPSGAPVAQVTITATNQANHDQRSVQTLSDGTYRLPDVLPGTYDITAAISGFSTSVSHNMHVLVNSSLLVN